MNKHYDNILYNKDKRFDKIFNTIVGRNEFREDILNDFYERYIKYKDSFNKLKGDDIYYYIVRILKQLCANYNNKYADWDIAETIHPEHLDNEYKIEWTFMEDALKTLTFYEREIVKLYYIEDKTYREISEETLIPITSLHLTTTKALKKLKKYYGVNRE